MAFPNGADVLLVIAWLGAGCGSGSIAWGDMPDASRADVSQGQPASGGDEEDDRETATGPWNACGMERWGVKVGTEAGARTVDPHPQETTVAQLGSLPVPAGFNMNAARLAPNEFQTYVLRDVAITTDKLETDGDYHLVLTENGATLIGEVPHPACVAASSPFACYLPAARKAVSNALTPMTVRVDPTAVGASAVSL